MFFWTSFEAFSVDLRSTPLLTAGGLSRAGRSNARGARGDMMTGYEATARSLINPFTARLRGKGMEMPQEMLQETLYFSPGTLSGATH